MSVNLTLNINKKVKQNIKKVYKLNILRFLVKSCVIHLYLFESFLIFIYFSFFKFFKQVNFHNKKYLK